MTRDVYVLIKQQKRLIQELMNTASKFTTQIQILNSCQPF